MNKDIRMKDTLRDACAIEKAMEYCHSGSGIDGCMVLHRVLKSDNIGYASDGTFKIIDFRLARLIIGASAYSNEVYKMTGETGSLRYMAPEVADLIPYNHKIDVYSFGILL